MKKILSLFLIFLVLFTKKSSALCQCAVYHPQERFCNSNFIATVHIFASQVNHGIDYDDERFLGLTRAHVYKILKGNYQDFREGNAITLVTPNNDCNTTLLAGYMLIAGFAIEPGVVVVDACSVVEKSLSSSQMNTIQHNIRNRAYLKGCEMCKIRKEYDYSYLKDNECRTNYEFPISTSACMIRPETGKCGWVRRARRHRFKDSYFTRIFPKTSSYLEPESGRKKEFENEKSKLDKKYFDETQNPKTHVLVPNEEDVKKRTTIGHENVTSKSGNGKVVKNLISVKTNSERFHIIVQNDQNSK